MNAETERVLRAPEATAPPRETDAGWRIVLPLVVLACAGIIALYRSTAESLVAIWSRSETFEHGFLILPISVVLIWMRRREVARLAPAPDFLGFLLLAGAGAAWLVAAAGQVQVVQQYAMVAMLPAAVAAIAGRQVAWALAFPLAFLFLGVPIGEALIAPLMDATADVAIASLRLTGIPVLREGNFFTIPSGHWSVVEGCSGVRYLIASITVGVLYAYLSYTKLWKRLLFIALSAVIPIVANWARAYMIVMIGHLSNMKLAHGVDHLIYGWVFFGLVMFLMFWAGSYWRDPAPQDSASAPRSVPSRETAVPPARCMVATVVVLAIAAAWPVYAAYIDRSGGAGASPVLAAPAGAAGWSLTAESLTDWRPLYDGAAATLVQVYRKGDQVVAVHLGFYRHQRKGAELLTSTNIMIVQKHPVWANIGESRRTEDLGRGPMEVRQTLLRSAGQRLVVWDWYRVSGRDLVSPAVGKLLLARDRLLGRGDDAAAIILFTPQREQPGAAEETLRQFARDMLPSIDDALARVPPAGTP
jgi:exosortase A